jgi:3'-phosphoadenosine 5'-phosphosulfate sulfotransferase (PAPS reductase)/FAD synthetase
MKSKEIAHPKGTLLVVQLSGGKDSQAVAKLVRKASPNERIVALFADTKFEHDLTYAHVLDCVELYNLDLVVLNNGSVEEQVTKWKRFPGGGARHCTEYLKIKPAKEWMIEQAKNGYKVINHLGIRSDESVERSKRYSHLMSDLNLGESFHPHEVMPSKCPQYMGLKYGIEYRLPVLDWTKGDIFAFLEGEENPLYSMGFDRVGCFPCLASGDKWKMKAFNHDHIGKRHYEIAKRLETITVAAGNHPLFTSKIGKKLECESDLNGCSFCSM